MPESILTSRWPLLHAAACRIHGEAEAFVVERCTEYHLTHVEETRMPYLPDLEGSDRQMMGNLRMNVGFFVKHSMRKKP